MTRDGSASPAPVIAARTRPSSTSWGWMGPRAAGAPTVASPTTSMARTVGKAASAHSWARIRRSDSEEEDDRNSAADALAQARIAAAPSTARITAGWRNGRKGARVHGGRKIVPPPDRRAGALGGGDAATLVRGASPTVLPGPRRSSRVVRTNVTVGGGADRSGGSVTGS